MIFFLQIIFFTGVQLAHMAFSVLLHNFPSASSLTFSYTRSRPLQSTSLSTTSINQLSHVTSLNVEFHSMSTSSICKILHHTPYLTSFTTSWTSKRAMQVRIHGNRGITPLSPSPLLSSSSSLPLLSSSPLSCVHYDKAQ